MQLLRRVKQAFNRPSSEERVVSKVQKLFEARDRSYLEAFHKQWFINVAMRRGHQWLLTSTTTNEIMMPPEETDRVRMTINEMLPIHTTKLAKLVGETPVWGVDYQGNAVDEDAKESARLDEAYLKSKFNSEDMSIEMLWFLGWALDTGNCFWKFCWDHDAGEVIPSFEDEDEEDIREDEEDGYHSEDGEKSRIIRPFDDEEVRYGDAQIITVPPFDLIPSSSGRPLKDQRWIMHVYEEDVETIRSYWKNGKKVRPEKGKDQRTYYQKRLATLIGVQNEFIASTDDPQKETATVIEFFERPTRERPMGTHIAICGKIWLNPSEEDPEEPGPLPYEYLVKKKKIFPFVHMIDIPVSGSFWGMGTMENLIAPQKGYNRAWSQVLENGNNFGNIKVMASTEANLSTEAFDDSGNEVIQYEPGHPPSMLQPASMPNTVMSQFDLYPKAFMDISGQHEPTRGMAPGGVTAGVALQTLQMQDDTRNKPTMMIFRNCLKEAGEHLLFLLREQMVEGEVRPIRYPIKKDGVTSYESMMVSRDQLLDDPNVSVQLESESSWSKEIRKQQIQNAYQMGLLGPQQDPQVRKQVLEALEFGDLQKFFEDSELDEKNAKENIDRIQEGRDLEVVIPAKPGSPGAPPDPITGSPGIPPSPPAPPVMGIKANPWEDHQTHLRVYNNFRKSARFRQWTPDQRAMLNSLAEEHARMAAPPPPPPEPPKVSISAKSEITNDQFSKVAGLPPPSPPPPGMTAVGGPPKLFPPGTSPSDSIGATGPGAGINPGSSPPTGGLPQTPEQPAAMPIREGG